MIPIVLSGLWLMSIASSVLVGRSPVPSNQHHGTAWVLAALCTCMHLAFGAVPVVVETRAADVQMVLYVATGVGCGVLAYALFRACLKVGDLTVHR